MDLQEYRRFVEAKVFPFEYNIKKEILYHRLQYASTALLMTSSVGLGVLYTNNVIKLQQAISGEIGILIGSFLAQYLLQEKRVEHYTELKRILASVRDRVSEDVKLLADQALSELGFKAERLPAEPEDLTKFTCVKISIRSLVEKLLPFLTVAFF